MSIRNTKDLIRTLKSITLPREYKERIRADLSAYADLHALNGLFVRESVRSPFSFLMPARSLYAGALTLVLMVAGGTQASLASEGAVPGDVLYPIKVAVNEPLSFIFTQSSEGKAELAAKFASRRVDEAATLSSAGKLDEKTADELAARFDTHVDVLAKETDTLEAKGEISVSLAVRTDLEQKLSERAEEFAVAMVAEEDVTSTSALSVVAEEGVADRFSARVIEKSKTLATTRERLESALALDIEADLKEGDLATFRANEAGSVSAARLFFAEGGLDAATSSATSSATTTEASSAETESPASRFFAPFMNR